MTNQVLFSLGGVVSPSSQRGRQLGFPTANLNLPTEGLEDGIYIAHTIYEGKQYQSLLFIGSALTFDETLRKVEVYLLDGNGDWYGREIIVEAYQKIRQNMKFTSAQALVQQIQQDVAVARRYFEQVGKA